jgi:hypothetical protein
MEKYLWFPVDDHSLCESLQLPNQSRSSHFTVSAFLSDSHEQSRDSGKGRLKKIFENAIVDKVIPLDVLGIQMDNITPFVPSFIFPKRMSVTFWFTMERGGNRIVRFSVKKDEKVLFEPYICPDRIDADQRDRLPFNSLADYVKVFGRDEDFPYPTDIEFTKDGRVRVMWSDREQPPCVLSEGDALGICPSLLIERRLSMVPNVSQ